MKFREFKQRLQQELSGTDAELEQMQAELALRTGPAVPGNGLRMPRSMQG